MAELSCGQVVHLNHSSTQHDHIPTNQNDHLPIIFFYWTNQILQLTVADIGTHLILSVVDKYLKISILKPVAVAEWSSLTDMPKVSRSALASYLCWNMHVGNQLAAMLATERSAGVAEVNLKERIWCMPPPSANKAATLALKTRGDVTRSPKQEYQRPAKTLISSKKLNGWLRYLVNELHVVLICDMAQNLIVIN